MFSDELLGISKRRRIFQRFHPDLNDAAMDDSQRFRRGWRQIDDPALCIRSAVIDFDLD